MAHTTAKVATIILTTLLMGSDKPHTPSSHQTNEKIRPIPAKIISTFRIGELVSANMIKLYMI